jgi:hypothetical protein
MRSDESCIFRRYNLHNPSGPISIRALTRGEGGHKFLLEKSEGNFDRRQFYATE